VLHLALCAYDDGSGRLRGALETTAGGTLDAESPRMLSLHTRRRRMHGKHDPPTWRTTKDRYVRSFSDSRGLELDTYCFVYRLGFLAKFSDLGDEAEEQQRERLGGKDATSILKYTKDTASSWIMRRSHTVLLCHLHTETPSHA
jgi:hypothetical protein